MKFCGQHWERLRGAIAARGLEALVSVGGHSAMEKLVDELQTKATTLDNFDPLMSAHWAIVGNATRILGNNGGLYLLMDGPEDPVDVVGYAGRTWPRCPLCYLNLAHEVSCKEADCRLDRVNGYDWMIDRAADEAKARVDDLMAGKP